ncbi:MAG: enoyl-CoA hydratase-related protein [Chloroflexota bacterium]
MPYETILFSQDGAVATVALNRPEALNSINLKLGEDLLECLERCAEDDAIRAVILTGKGRAFFAGADLRQVQANLNDAPHLLKQIIQRLHPAISAIRRMPKPVICAVNGVAAGAGFPLAICCDIVIAAESARFNMAYVNIGLNPDGGSTFFLPRVLGLQRASWLFFTGEFVDARRGVELGFVNQVVPDDKLMDTATALARRLAAGPTMAMGRAKALINQSFSESMETQMECENRAIAQSAATEDFREGITAFLGKRPPQFRGR